MPPPPAGGDGAPPPPASAPPRGDRKRAAPAPRPLGESIFRARDAATRLGRAHLALLQAELAVTGREIGIIIGLAIAALSLALLIIGLLYTGTWLFLGEWLFGSIGWGVLHGTLFTIAFIVPIGLNLGGGWGGAWGRGLLAGLLVTVGLSILFGTNLLRNGAVMAGDALEASLSLEPAILPTLVGVVAGALVVGLALFILGLRGGQAFKLLLSGALLGAAAGAILGSVVFDLAGAVAVGLTFGLIAWIGVTILIAYRRGFDPAARYDPLVPRESIAALEGTKVYLSKQWERQRRKVMGR